MSPFTKPKELDQHDPLDILVYVMARVVVGVSLKMARFIGRYLGG
jgi:hypothetical protein